MVFCGIGAISDEVPQEILSSGLPVSYNRNNFPQICRKCSMIYQNSTLFMSVFFFFSYFWCGSPQVTPTMTWQHLCRPTTQHVTATTRPQRSHASPFSHFSSSDGPCQSLSMLLYVNKYMFTSMYFSPVPN